MMGFQRILAAACVAAVAPAMPAHAYKIMAPRVHEAITLAAQYCMDEAKSRNALPTDCSRYRDKIADYSKPQYSLTSLQREVRWPDDPRREIKSAGFAKPLQNGRWKACQGKLARSRAVQHVGTFCSSHFGEWQFFHAMSVSRPDGTGAMQTDDPATTRAKILEWASFTYDVAAGNVLPSAGYCETFNERGGLLSKVMVPGKFGFCSGKSPWTVGSFFSVRCGELLFFGRCRPLKQDDEFVRTVASGALLHLVQDSYSQSHARRTDRVAMTGDALIECGKPREYYVYDEKNQETHDVADQVPGWGESCAAGSPTDDAITASAMVLAYLDRHASRDEFLRYLENHVF